jgi:hypothetical protein
MSEEECLHCKINKLVDEHIEGLEPVNVADLVMKMAESLADLIHIAPKEDHANLLAHAMAHLGDMYVEKMGAGEGDTTH